MRKSRVFINIHYLEIGGAEAALIGLLMALDPEKVEVDLFLNQHTGEMLKFVPDWVNILPVVSPYDCIERPIIDIVKDGHFVMALRRLWAKYKHKRYSRFLKSEDRIHDASIFQYIADAVEICLPSLEGLGTYDLAISFLAPHNIVLKKISAKKKVCWIHTDYSTIRINQPLERPVWAGFDWIASISEDVRNSFIKCFPSLESKIIDIENMLSVELVRSRAGEFDASPEFTGSINLLSIGRFCTAKNYDNVPDIARRMVESGLTGLRWYIIGYGGDEGLIRRKIAEAGMQEHVILLGKKENPYPYIAACDIYVQPSRYEGKSVTVREAQILCKPVAVTAYPTAPSQINDGIDGVIVPLDNAGCAAGLTAFVADQGRRERITAHLRTHDYANTSEVEKIYELLK